MSTLDELFASGQVEQLRQKLLNPTQQASTQQFSNQQKPLTEQTTQMPSTQQFSKPKDTTPQQPGVINTPPSVVEEQHLNVPVTTSTINLQELGLNSEAAAAYLASPLAQKTGVDERWEYNQALRFFKEVVDAYEEYELNGIELLRSRSLFEVACYYKLVTGQFGHIEALKHYRYPQVPKERLPQVIRYLQMRGHNAQTLPDYDQLQSSNPEQSMQQTQPTQQPQQAAQPKTKLDVELEKISQIQNLDNSTLNEAVTVDPMQSIDPEKIKQAEALFNVPKETINAINNMPDNNTNQQVVQNIMTTTLKEQPEQLTFDFSKPNKTTEDKSTQLKELQAKYDKLVQVVNRHISLLDATLADVNDFLMTKGKKVRKKVAPVLKSLEDSLESIRKLI